jgi:hypothetical protein
MARALLLAASSLRTPEVVEFGLSQGSNRPANGRAGPGWTD